MKLHRYEKASDYEVQAWLEKNLDLTPYQKEKIYNSELIRFAPFEFYKRRKEKTSPIWRLSIIPWIPYIIILFTFLPFNWIFTGHWGYGDKLYNFHSKWRNKIGF